MKTRLVLAAGTIGIGLLPLTGSVFYMQLLSKIMVLAIFAMSLDLLVGYCGLVSLGHAAFFGVGAYAIALLSPRYQAANFWVTFPLTLAIVALLAFAIGLLVVRASGVYFIMVTLAFAQMLYYLVHDTKLGGGSDGLYLYLRPEISLGGFKLLNLESPRQFYYLVFGLMLAVFFLLRTILASAFGHALFGMRVNELRMRSLGFATFWYKLGAFVLAGALAGLAGYLAACQFGFVNPEILSWHYSGSVLMMLILGGMGRLYGAVVGSFALVLLQEMLSSDRLFGPWAKHWQLPMGIFIVLVVLLAPSGLTGFAPARKRSNAALDV